MNVVCTFSKIANTHALLLFFLLLLLLLLLLLTIKKRKNKSIGSHSFYRPTQNAKYEICLAFVLLLVSCGSLYFILFRISKHTRILSSFLLYYYYAERCFFFFFSIKKKEEKKKTQGQRVHTYNIIINACRIWIRINYKNIFFLFARPFDFEWLWGRKTTTTTPSLARGSIAHWIYNNNIKTQG